MKENQLTKQDIRDLLAENTERTIKPLIYEMLMEHTERALEPMMSTMIDNAIEKKIEPVIRKIVDESTQKIIADIGKAIENFIDSTDGRFVAIEYDVSKNKQDITALKKLPT